MSALYYTFFERVFSSSEEKVLDGEQPVKDAHDSHVVEQNGETCPLLGGAVVQLHLQVTFVAIFPGHLQNVGEDVWPGIGWLI